MITDDGYAAGRRGPIQRDSDGELVRRARHGDREAFDRLVRRNRPLLTALCHQALGDPLLAEDGAQEAVLQAMLALDRLRDPRAFGPWLAGIGIRVCRRMARSRRREPWSSETSERGADPAPPTNGDRAAALEARVRDAVDALPEGQRRAVRLFYLSGLTERETADELGIGIGAAKARLHRARRTLRDRLDNLWEGSMNGDEAKVVRMAVADVRRGPATEEFPGRHVVILREVDGERRLPIWIGSSEATALALTMERAELPRPMTYRFAHALLTALDASLLRVRVNRLSEGTY